MASSPTGTKKCDPCPPAICTTPCKEEEVCSISVITNLCECPVAKCVNISGIEGGGNDRPNGGNNNDNTDKEPTDAKGPSVLGPVLGSLLGLGVVGLAIFLFLRRRRQRRRTNNTHLLQASHMEDSLTSLTVKSQYGSSSEMAGHRDVIRIAYIPSMISDSSPLQVPPQVASADSMSPPKAAFMGSGDSDRSKHDSIASTASTDVLEAAVVTTVTQSKATPQVMRLNTIKRDNSDLIHRSNSLHSNNSLKRSSSQRKLAQARQKVKSPLGSTTKRAAAGQSSRSAVDSDSDDEDDEHSESEDEDDKERMRCDGNDVGSPFRDTRESIEYTPAVMVTGPSVRSSMRSTASGPGGAAAATSASGPRSPKMVLGPLPIDKQYPTTATTSATSTSTIVVAPAHIPGSATTTSKDSEAYDDDDDPLSLLDIHGTHNLRPWARGSMASSGTRDSTFSTASDARSSTRGDGEEIMIFWDGLRNSTRSSVQDY